MKLTGEPKLHVKILSPTETYYDGMALAVTAVNKVGKFDILADHANFFSMITEGDIVVRTPVEELKFPVDKGIVKVTKNIVTFFVNIEPAYSNKNEM